MLVLVVTLQTYFRIPITVCHSKKYLRMLVTVFAFVNVCKLRTLRMPSENVDLLMVLTRNNNITDSRRFDVADIIIKTVMN